MGYTPDQVEMAKQLQSSYRSGSQQQGQRRPGDGLTRPQPPKKMKVLTPEARYGSQAPHAGPAARTPGYAGPSNSYNATNQYTPQRLQDQASRSGPSATRRPHPGYAAFTAKAYEAPLNLPSARELSSVRRRPDPAPTNPQVPVKTTPGASTAPATESNTGSMRAMPAASAPANYSGQDSNAAPTMRMPPHTAETARPASSSMSSTTGTGSAARSTASAAEVKKTSGEASRGQGSDDVWKPVISYYLTEPYVKPTCLVAKDAVKDTVAKNEVNTNEGQVSQESGSASSHPKPLQQLARESQKSSGTSPDKDYYPLYSDFEKVKLSDDHKSGDRRPADQERWTKNEPTFTLPAHAPEGLREAMEMNRAGKAVKWNWNTEKPQVREVSKEELEGLKYTQADADEFDRRWRRPWNRPPAGPRQPRYTTPMDLDPEPPVRRERGLKGSRHNT